MRMDSEMIGILLSDSMHYTIVVSLEMSDEPKISLKNKNLSDIFFDVVYTSIVDTLTADWYCLPD